MTSIFDKDTLTKMLLNNSYSFPGDPFEPSSDKPIDEDKLTSFTQLKDYLGETYGTSEKVDIHRKTIEKIVGDFRADNLLELNKSDYFKVLTHFTILSKVKKGWFNLFVTSPTRTSKPSLSDNPSFLVFNKSKELHDSIIRCFYSRIIQGMTGQEKERYQILLPPEQLPQEKSPTHFDQLLFGLDQAIQSLFSLVHQKTEGYADERLLPDAGLDEAIEKTRTTVHAIFSENVKESYSADTLRATLIKFASINRATNDIDAILNIYNEVVDSLPDDIRPLKRIESEPDILPAIINIFKGQGTTRKKVVLPDDLIECSKLVCKMYINTSVPPTETAGVLEGFNNHHMEPASIAVSAALLYHDFLQQKKLNLNIRGETNKSITVYKTLSELANRLPSTDILTTERLSERGVPEELFKYLTTRYSISMFGLSDFYPSQQGAAAHLKVRAKKLELQKEAYGLLKDMSVKDAHQCISNLYLGVNEYISTLTHPRDE